MTTSVCLLTSLLATTMSNQAELKAQRIFPQNAQHNALVLSNIKFVSSCFVGAVAGILGLENFYGFLLFGISLFATAGIVVSMKCKDPSIQKYIAGGWAELINPGQENIFSFVLLWTLFYGVFVSPRPNIIISNLTTSRGCTWYYIPFD